ncbi:MAG: FkbM family methyltransferase [Methylobacter sp.]|nr:FkbM family methyltransferase [Methylobacter sp.]
MQLLKTLLVRTLNDPLVVYSLDGSDILLPLSHNLPLIRKAYPHYSINVARIAEVLKIKYPDMSLIDIGANVGDTVAILRHRAHFPIICIDGDKNFFAILAKNAKNWSDVELVNSFVGDTTGNFSGRIKILGGTGHLVEDQHSNQELKIKKLSSILRENSRFSNAKMIKIDTDGFDCKILNSELALLKGLKPVLFFEYDPYFFNKFNDKAFQIFHNLREIGYQAMLIFENTGEYLIHLDLSNDLLLEDIHQFYSGWEGRKYCDICIFHEMDLDVFKQARLNEIEFFKRARSNENPL